MGGAGGAGTTWYGLVVGGGGGGGGGVGVHVKQDDMLFVGRQTQALKSFIAKSVVQIFTSWPFFTKMDLQVRGVIGWSWDE